MSTGAPSSALIAVGDVLHNGAIRRIEIAWTAGMAADGAFLVILLVVAYQAGGAVAAGILGAVRVVPSIIAAPFAPGLVVRFRGDRVLAAINVVRALGAIVTAAIVAIGLPTELTYLLAAVVAGAGSLVRAIQTALLPAFARSPRELVAANVASSMGEGLGTFIGPLLAGILLATTGSVSASILVAATFAGAAAALTGVRFERSVDARGGIEPESKRPRISEAPSVLRHYPTALVVTSDFAIQSLVRGLLVTLTVVGSIELLGMGDSGVGLLTAAIGIGGLTGALGALGLKGGSGLGRVFVLALAAWGLPLVLIGAVPAPVVALAALFVVGGSNAVLDVSGFTLLQRGVRDEAPRPFDSPLPWGFEPGEQRVRRFLAPCHEPQRREQLYQGHRHRAGNSRCELRRRARLGSALLQHSGLHASGRHLPSHADASLGHRARRPRIALLAEGQAQSQIRRRLPQVHLADVGLRA